MQCEKLSKRKKYCLIQIIIMSISWIVHLVKKKITHKWKQNLNHVNEKTNLSKKELPLKFKHKKKYDKWNSNS